ISLKETKIYSSTSLINLEYLIDRIRFKILDNLEFEKEKICQNCGKVIKYRNWITYFGHVTNVSVLRGLDIWI
uniref:hypothetical protein n=1 Tax=Clostridioides difficile TaxID=1496 RepID=UPI001A9132B4